MQVSHLHSRCCWELFTVYDPFSGLLTAHMTGLGFYTKSVRLLENHWETIVEGRNFVEQVEQPSMVDFTLPAKAAITSILRKALGKGLKGEQRPYSWRDVFFAPKIKHMSIQAFFCIHELLAWKKGWCNQVWDSIAHFQCELISF